MRERERESSLLVLKSVTSTPQKPMTFTLLVRDFRVAQGLETWAVA